MKPIIFLSYAAESKDEADWIEWYFHRYLAWNVFNYAVSGSRIPGSAPDALEEELRKSDLFIQILKTTLGNAAEWTSSNPILQWEFETFQKKHPHEISRYLLLNFQEGNEITKKYISEVSNFVNPRTPTSVQDMLADVMNFATQQQSRYGELVGGFLDFRSEMELLDIRKDLAKNRLAKSDVIMDQKHLYASPYAAQLWIDLTTHNRMSPLKIVYDRYPFDNDIGRMPPVAFNVRKSMQKWISQLKTGAGPLELNVIVLGGGDGIRELKTCKWLHKECDVAAINALLVDISPDLLAVAAEHFKSAQLTGANTSFAIIDIEQRPEAIREVRQRMMPTGPGLFVFLGPTLCNVTGASVLEDLQKHGMESGDVMFCEVLLCDTPTAQLASLASSDARFDFITSPLLTLGIVPNRELFFEETTVDSDKMLQSHVWFYGSGADRYSLATVMAMQSKHWEEVFKSAGFEVLDIQEHEYKVQDKKIKFGYIVAKKP